MNLKKLYNAPCLIESPILRESYLRAPSFSPIKNHNDEVDVTSSYLPGSRLNEALKLFVNKEI